MSPSELKCDLTVALERVKEVQARLALAMNDADPWGGPRVPVQINHGLADDIMGVLEHTIDELVVRRVRARS